MTSTRHNFSALKQRGYATLATTVVVLLLITFIAFLTARSVLIGQQTTTNQYRTQQAFDAAQSGLEYGLVYLNEQTAITDGMETAGTLPNGSVYTITYVFQEGNNILINIISNGVSEDGVAKRRVEQLVKKSNAIPSEPLKVRGQVDMSGNAVITNLEGNRTIYTGDPAVTLSQGAQTVLAGGVSSTAGNIRSDIVYVAALATVSDDNLMTGTLGATITQLSDGATVTASGSGKQNYNTLVNGLSGTTIHITQSGEVQLNSNVVVGTTESPVNLIVLGALALSDNAVIYGNVIATGGVALSGNIQVHGLVFSLGDVGVNTAGAANHTPVQGAVVVGGLFSGTGNAHIAYNSTILRTTLGTGTYGKVPGSWKDISGEADE